MGPAEIAHLLNIIVIENKILKIQIVIPSVKKCQIPLNPIRKISLLVLTKRADASNEENKECYQREHND